jgi:DNA-binding GntR family transcriptional regulator
MANAVDRAYDAIRSDILSGVLKPGERLREEDLVRRIGVSRTPVREALRRLEADGYTIVQPNRGAMVPHYSKRDVDEIYGLRALLEGHAARRAATRVKPEHIERLETLSLELKKLADQKQKKSTPDADLKRQLLRTKINHEFHETILEAADNTRLGLIVRQLAQVALSVRTFAHYDADDINRSIESHDELIRALKSGHPDWAEATMRSHVHNARQILTAITPVDGEADEDAS